MAITLEYARNAIPQTCACRTCRDSVLAMDDGQEESHDCVTIELRCKNRQEIVFSGLFRENEGFISRKEIHFPIACESFKAIPGV